MEKPGRCRYHVVIVARRFADGGCNDSALSIRGDTLGGPCTDRSSEGEDMTKHTKETMTPGQLLLRVVGVAFASVMLFVLLAVLGQGGGTAEAADHPAGLGDLLGPGATGNVLAPIVAPVADVVTPILQPLTPVATPAADTLAPVLAPVLQTLTPVVTPVVTPLADVVAPIADTVDPVVTPITDAVAPVVEPLVPLVDPVAPVGDPVAPVGDPVAPSAIRSLRSFRPVTGGNPPDVDTVVPPATAGPASETTAPSGSTVAPDPAARCCPRSTVTRRAGRRRGSDRRTGRCHHGRRSRRSTVADLQRRFARRDVRSRPCHRRRWPFHGVVQRSDDVRSGPAIRIPRFVPRRLERPWDPAEHRDRAALGRHLVVAHTGRRSHGDVGRADRHRSGDVHAVASRHDRCVVALRARALLGRTSWVVTPSVRDRAPRPARRPVERSIFEGEPT